MKPGVKPRRENRDGRCLQLSTACALGIPWRKAAKGWDPDIESEAEYRALGYAGFYERWEDELYALGFKALRFNPNGVNEPDGYWIAIVSRGHHAVVMAGNKLHYDPNGVRTHRPHKFTEAFELVPHGNH